MHGNCAKTFLIGDVSEKDKFLCDVAELCLDEAIRICGPGVPFSEIGNTIEDIVDEHGLRLVSERMGHGIGTYLHGPPGILHCGMLIVIAFSMFFKCTLFSAFIASN